MNPGRHAHTKPPGLCVQQPPFIHGLESQLATEIIKKESFQIVVIFSMPLSTGDPQVQGNLDAYSRSGLNPRHHWRPACICLVLGLTYLSTHARSYQDGASL